MSVRIVGKAELERFCALPGLGICAPDDVRRHAPDASLLLERQGAGAARCSLWWRAAPPLEGERVGLIGHYAACDPASAAAILEAACRQLRTQGCTLAVAPMDGSTWRRYRLLTWRGAEPPFFLEPDNPDEWAQDFAGAGFAPLAQYFSAMCDDLLAYDADGALDAALRKAGYGARPIDLDRADEELALLWRLATRAFARNFLFTPIAEAEFKAMYAPILPAARRELVSILEHQGEAVGFAFAMPDVLQAMRGERVDTVILKTLGVLPDRQGLGLGNWLVDRTFAAARLLGFRKGIVALMHEANPSRRLGRGMLRDMRRYTLFARRL